MSDHLRKPRFVRKLEFDANNSGSDTIKLKSCKIVNRGRNNQTLPINLNSTFASLKHNSSSEDNPFEFISKINNQSSLTRHRDLFDVVPGCSKSKPKTKTKNTKRSPKIGSSSKTRLKINRYTKNEAILKQREVEVTKNTANSPKIKTVLNSPRSTSKFVVSSCVEENANSNFGHSPSFKLQKNISWNQTNVNDCEPNQETIMLLKSPCFVVSTPSERKKIIFKRNKLKNVPEEKASLIDCENYESKKIGINSEFLKTDPKQSFDLSPIMVIKSGKSQSTAELEKSPIVLNKMAVKRFPRLTKTPEKLIISPHIENQDFPKTFHQFIRTPEIQLECSYVQKSSNVISSETPRLLEAEAEKSTPKKNKLNKPNDSSPIITLRSSNKHIKTNKIIKISFEELEKARSTPIKDCSQDMIIDSSIVKTNSLKSKRINRISNLLKTSKLIKQATPKSPLVKTNSVAHEIFLSSPEIITRSPVLSKKTKSKLKKFSNFPKNYKKMTSEGCNKNIDLTLNEPNVSLIIGISPKCVSFTNFRDRISDLNKSPEKVQRKIVETQNLTIPFLKRSSKNSICKSPEILLCKRKNLDCKDVNISFSINSPNTPISKSPEISILKQKYSVNQDWFSDILLSPESSHPKLPKVSLSKQKSPDDQNGPLDISFPKYSPNMTTCKSPEMSLAKQKCSDMESDISFSKNSQNTSICKSPEISLVKLKSSINQISNSNISFYRNSLNKHKSKSPEMALVKRTCSHDTNLDSEKSPSLSITKSPEISFGKQKRLDNSDNNLGISFSPKSKTNPSLIVGVSPKYFKVTNINKVKNSKNDTEINKSPQKEKDTESVSLRKTNRKIHETRISNSSISFSEHSLCKSPEILSLKRKNVDVLNRNFFTSPKLSLCKSPEISSIKKKSIVIHNDTNLSSCSPKMFSLNQSPCDGTLNCKNLVVEPSDSTFVEPDPPFVVGISPKYLNFSNGTDQKKVPKTQENSPKSYVCKSPKISSIKKNSKISLVENLSISGRSLEVQLPVCTRRTIGVSPKCLKFSNGVDKRRVPEAQENSPQSSFCKSPEISSIKKKSKISLKENLSTKSQENLVVAQKRLNFVDHTNKETPKVYDQSLNIFNAENTPETFSRKSPLIANLPNSISCSPIISKIKNRKVRVFSSGESCKSAQDEEIEECSSTISDQLFLKKNLAPIVKIGLETQLIDEFYTETLHLAATCTKNEGWNSEAAISEILSEEKSRQFKSSSQASGLQVPEVKPPKRKKLKSKDSISAQLDAARKSLISERRIREYERIKNSESLVGSKEFYVTESWGLNPQKIQAITDEGEAMLILGEGLVYSQDDVKPGCNIRIYPPWQTLKTQQGLTIYLSIRICDILPGTLPQDTNYFANMEEEMSIEPYLEDPNLIMKVLLNEPDSDN